MNRELRGRAGEGIVIMGETGDGASRSPMRSLERTFTVMQVLQEAREPVRLSDVARGAGLHVATTQRILRVLEQHGYAVQTRLGYTLGPSSLLNAHAFIVSNPLSRVAAPILQELAQACGLTASLAVRVRNYKVLIGRVEGSSALRYQLPIGEALPLHLGSGRILAAAMMPEELTELIDQIAEIRLATGQTLSREELIARLEQIRADGFAVSYSERTLGAASLGVPVLGAGGTVVAALQLSGLADDLAGPRIDALLGELRRAAAAISARLG